MQYVTLVLETILLSFDFSVINQHFSAQVMNYCIYLFLLYQHLTTLGAAQVTDAIVLMLKCRNRWVSLVIGKVQIFRHSLKALT